MCRLIFLLSALSLLTSCTTIEHMVREEPVGSEEASTGLGVDITDSTIGRHIGVNIMKSDPELETANINIKPFCSERPVTWPIPRCVRRDQWRWNTN